MRDLAPHKSPQAFIGKEVRRIRLAADLTQRQLGDLTNYSESAIAKFEKQGAPPEFLIAADKALECHGMLAHLEDLAKAQRYPPGFWPWLEIEKEAQDLVNFEPLVLPGLLQTEAYARALTQAFPVGTADDVEEIVQGRMERQSVLADEGGPTFIAVISESVLSTPVGGPDVMATQLRTVLEVGERPHVHLQVLPSDAGAHAGLAGAFVVATMRDGSHAVLLDHLAQGTVTRNADDVRIARDALNAIRANALPERMSAQRIQEVMDQWKTQE